jgi:hypothetical protein
MSNQEIGNVFAMVTSPAPFDMEGDPTIQLPALEDVPLETSRPPAEAGLRLRLERLAASGGRVARVLIERLSVLRRSLRLDRVVHACVSAAARVLSRLSAASLPGRAHPKEPSRVLRFRITDTELAMVLAIADRWQCRPSDIVRALLRQQFRNLVAGGAESSSGEQESPDDTMEWPGVRRKLVMPPEDSL